MHRRALLSATAAALAVPLLAGCTRDGGGTGGGEEGGTTDGDGGTTTEPGGGGPYGRVGDGAGSDAALGPAAESPDGAP